MGCINQLVVLNFCRKTSAAIYLLKSIRKYFANSLAENTSIERGSINDALETMKLIEIIYKADPIWKEKYYK